MELRGEGEGAREGEEGAWSVEILVVSAPSLMAVGGGDSGIGGEGVVASFVVKGLLITEKGSGGVRV